jgi:hypothetical protein
MLVNNVSFALDKRNYFKNEENARNGLFQNQNIPLLKVVPSNSCWRKGAKRGK